MTSFAPKWGTEEPQPSLRGGCIALIRRQMGIECVPLAVVQCPSCNGAMGVNLSNHSARCTRCGTRIDPRSAKRISVVHSPTALPTAVAEANAQLQGEGEGSLHTLAPKVKEGATRRARRIQLQVLFLTTMEVSFEQLERELAREQVDRFEIQTALQSLIDTSEVFEPAPGRYRRVP